MICRGGFAAVVGLVFLLAQMASFMGPGRTGPGLRCWALALLMLAEASWPVAAVSEPGKWDLDINSVSFLLVPPAVILCWFV